MLLILRAYTYINTCTTLLNASGKVQGLYCFCSDTCACGAASLVSQECLMVCVCMREREMSSTLE